MKRLCLLAILFSTSTFAQDENEENSQDNVIRYQYNLSNAGDVEVSAHSSSQRLFKNPSLSSGLSSGTKAINRSIESLMEAVFYSILDREFIFDINDVSTLGIVLKRDVFPTTRGMWVVVDRFSIGPRYNKFLADVGKIPVNLTADTSSNVYDIYLRSDAVRLAEDEDLPFWRMAFNNWFGFLPFLTTVVPPAFNANELYDPMRLVQNPFTFPRKKFQFYKMDVGGIRSYSLSGGIKVPIDFANLLDDQTKEEIEKIDDAIVELPYSVFVEGESRVNVLRRSHHTAWIGLSKNKRIGHAIASRVGQTLKVFQEVSKYWSGLPVGVFPVDFALTQAKANIYDQLYEFDMRNPIAVQAYEKAAEGDFTFAYKKHLDRTEKGIKTGVKFHFTRDEDAVEYEGRNSFNAFIGRKSRDTFQNASEIEIKSPEGVSHVLQSKVETLDESWDMLVGTQRETNIDKAEMKVRKVLEKEGEKTDSKYKYVFAASEENPVSIFLNMNINDAYADSLDYRRYLDKLRSFTRLSLKSAPNFALRETAKIKYRRKRFALIDPTQDEFNTHVSFTQLGRFDAVASIHLNTNAIKHIIHQPEDRMWFAFAKAYGRDPSYWSKKKNRVGFSSAYNWTISTLFYPLRLFNVRAHQLDFIREASGRISALRDLRFKKTPLEKLDAFDSLFSTDHPDELARALLLLSPVSQVPRSVTLYTKPKGSASAAIKDRFKKLNGKVFKADAGFPPKDRAQIADEKLKAFFPLSLRERRKKSEITGINVRTQKLPPKALKKVSQRNIVTSSGSALRLDTRHIVVEVEVQKIHLRNNKARFFVRVEHGGELQFGRFLVAEKVFSIKPTLTSFDEGVGPENNYKFSFWLTGPLSPLSSNFFDQAVNFGGTFTVNISSSGGGKVWSNDRTLRFYFENGKITPP